MEDISNNAMTSPDKITSAVAAHRLHTMTARPFPDAGDCALFALTEAGELIDAWLRENPLYLRNNYRQPSAQEEAADLGYMIASCIVALRAHRTDGADGRATQAAAIIDRVCWAVTSLYRGYPESAGSNMQEALEEWLQLCDQCGWEPHDLIADVCARIDAKWAAQP
jgi:hypothetical protein